MLDSEHFPLLRKITFIWVGYNLLRAPYRMVRLRSCGSWIVTHLWTKRLLPAHPQGSALYLKFLNRTSPEPAANNAGRRLRNPPATLWL